MAQAAPSTPELLLGLVFIGVIGLAIASWMRLVYLNKERKALVPYVERRAVPWGLIDLFGVAMIYVTLQVVAVAIAAGPNAAGDRGIADLSAEEQMPVMIMFAVASVLTLFVGIAFLRFRSGATLRDLGISPSRFVADFKSAALLFGLMIIPIFALQLTLQQLSDEPTHPIVKMLLESATPAFFIVSAVVAVIVAPLIEEFLFRVLLQGWLENLSLLYPRGTKNYSEKERNRLVLGGEGSGDVAALLPTSADDPAAVEPALETNDNPYASPAISSLGKVAGAGESDEEKFRPQPAMWPIVISSICFALAHFGHGTDPIPLFFFALGLGWLYQRTHRMWPCVLVHMMLNGLSMVQLFLYLQSQAP